MSFNIAIDGPAGAGKSTIAKKLAKKISFIYVDTGAMYRAMGYYFIQHGIAAEDETGIQESCGKIQVSLAYENGVQKVLLNGTDISDKIRQEEVGNMASATSGYPFVRAKLLDLQRDMATQHNVIMDGRDIGTCVLPEAQLKVFLTASVEVRAKRRFDELTQKGESCDLEAIARDIKERDERDMNREIAPLRAAEDAVLLDSSNLNIDEVVEKIYGLAKKAGLEA